MALNPIADQMRASISHLPREHHTEINDHFRIRKAPELVQGSHWISVVEMVPSCSFARVQAFWWGFGGQVSPYLLPVLAIKEFVTFLQRGSCSSCETGG